MDLNIHPTDDADALARANLYERDDPFKSVSRALLSSAEIDDYARVTGMVFPFDPKRLKPASYEVHLRGTVIWWNGRGEKVTKNIEPGEELKLEPNSIVFVQVEPEFRLPYYIAIRFNLRITHVHRGLLLGTGPLVDPGFRGKLLIPLHNLTSDPYFIDTTSALIWIEFTKTSFGSIVTDQHASKIRNEATFPEDKRGLKPEDYLRKANGGNPIRSSIPDAVEDARSSAQSANEQISSLKRIGFWGGGIAAITIFAALVGVAFQVYQMVQSADGLVASVQQTIVPIVGDMKVNGGELKTTNSDLRDASERLSALQIKVDQMSQQIEKLSQKPATPEIEPTKIKRERRAKRATR
jgi:deoxycytidine triphosphate deaminase